MNTAKPWITSDASECMSGNLPPLALLGKSLMKRLNFDSPTFSPNIHVSSYIHKVCSTELLHHQSLIRFKVLKKDTSSHFSKACHFSSKIELQYVDTSQIPELSLQVDLWHHCWMQVC